jgi:hypothetical protein
MTARRKRTPHITATAPKPAPVTVGRLRLVRCSECSRRLPTGDASASAVLTGHYRSAHPLALAGTR